MLLYSYSLPPDLYYFDSWGGRLEGIARNPLRFSGRDGMEMADMKPTFPYLFTYVFPNYFPIPIGLMKKHLGKVRYSSYSS